MTFFDLLAVTVAAGVGGVLGALVPPLWRWLRRRSQGRPVHPVAHHVDPQLQQRLHDVSAAWAARRGYPAAGPLAAGYLLDAAQDVLDRWEHQR